jgi:hypothetical protein
VLVPNPKVVEEGKSYRIVFRAKRAKPTTSE